MLNQEAAAAVDDDAEVIELWRSAPALEALNDMPGRPEWDTATERRIAPADWLRFEAYIGEIFTALGMDADTPGTRETPPCCQSTHQKSTPSRSSPRCSTST